MWFVLIREVLTCGRPAPVTLFWSLQVIFNSYSSSDSDFGFASPEFYINLVTVSWRMIRGEKKIQFLLPQTLITSKLYDVIL